MLRQTAGSNGCGGGLDSDDGAGGNEGGDLDAGGDVGVVGVV